MKYGDYVWPHNPRLYEMEFSRRIVNHKVPFGTYILSDLGRDARILRGEGEFVGEGAYEEFKKLANLFYLNEPKILVHPIWQSAKAWFVSLKLKQEPKEDFVSYEFEFLECCDGYSAQAKLVPQVKDTAVNVKAGCSAAKKTWTVKKGDTMWAIARANSMTLAQLVALNPQVKNPNLIHAGDMINLS